MSTTETLPGRTRIDSAQITNVPRFCDWQGCDDPHVQPATLRLHREAGDPADLQDGERTFWLCPVHVAALVNLVENCHRPPSELPFDLGAGER